jgi:UPF0042 nucleotide-binding protein
MLITGMSGSGKSIALKALEDTGYYCVDNLPPSLLHLLINSIKLTDYKRVAVAIDARSGNDFSELPLIINQLKLAGHKVDILFLNASDDVLIRRFSETRRPHPLTINQQDKNLSQVIAHERACLEIVQELSYSIDTSILQNNALRILVQNIVNKISSNINNYNLNEENNLLLTIQSFGFKYGIPNDVDFMFDVRHLPNPYYDMALRPLTGLDKPVQEFLQQYETVEQQIQDIVNYFNKWLPHFMQNRAYVTIGIGCTGGQHRSVYIVEKLAELLRYKNTIIRHRQSKV